VAVDTAGNVYVADTSNHRVLVYLDPQNTDTVADLVLGQPNFTSKRNMVFVGVKVLGASTLCFPVSPSTLCFPYGVTVDTAGNVYVADNNRVLVYDGFLDLTPMPTRAGYDDPFATPLTLKKKSNEQFH
jgi:DNA-binding beta-propeller fold protein YncE